MNPTCSVRNTEWVLKCVCVCVCVCVQDSVSYQSQQVLQAGIPDKNTHSW